MISKEEKQRVETIITMFEELITAIDQCHDGKIDGESLMTQRCISKNNLETIKQFYTDEKIEGESPHNSKNTKNSGDLNNS